MPHDIDSELVKRLGRAVIQSIDDHETGDHHGERCSEERSNIIGYLAHTLRLTKEEYLASIKHFLNYEVEHQQRVQDMVGEVEGHATTGEPGRTKGPVRND